jgi:O-antigen/teichoic acid export membrane protein
MLPSQPIATPGEELHGSKANGPGSRSLLRALRYLLPANQILALADQIVVSATSFLVFVAIARSTNPGELGSYALAVSVLAFCLSTQESLITRPYAIKLHEPVGRPGQHAFGVLVLSLGLCGVFALAASATALTVVALGAPPELIHLVWAVTGALPFVLMREFARRFAFAHLAVSQALMLDVAVALLTLVAAALFYWTGTMSAPAMLAATGVSCALATPIWLYAVHRQFSAGLQSLASVLRQCWELGKWFLWGQLGLQVQNYLTPWLALVISGAAVAGLYAACASIVAFTNPVIFGFYNILTPKFVRIFHQAGIAALRRRAISDALFLSGIMAAFWLVVFAFGSDIMRLLYRDEIYAANSNVLVLLALAALAATVGVPASLALAATGRARPVAAVTLLTALVNISLIVLLLPWWGLWGAALAILIGEVLGAIARWTAFWLLAPLADTSAGSREPSSAWPLKA